MSFLAKLFAAVGAALAGLLFVSRWQVRREKGRAEKAEDAAAAAPLEAEVKEKTERVAQDGKESKDAVDAYRRYRHDHPEDGPSGTD